MTTPAQSGVGRIAPLTGNLSVLKGQCTFTTPTINSGNAFHLGNVPTFDFTPKIDLLDHYTSMIFQLARDSVIPIKETAEVKMALEELTYQNLQLMLTGDADLATPLQPIVHIGSVPALTGQLNYYGTNIYGPRYYVTLPSVLLNPTGNLGLISDKYANMEVSGQVNYDFTNLRFGTIQLQPPIGTVAPEYIMNPIIDGALAHPAVITAYLGLVIGYTSVTYQWKRGGVNISGATSSTYTTTVTDASTSLTCTITATNSIGSTSATSNALAIT